MRKYTCITSTLYGSLLSMLLIDYY